MTPEHRLALIRLLILLFVITLVVLIFVFRDRVSELASYGYAGVFLIAMISNATVLLPMPSVMVVFAMGAIFNPWLTAIFAGLGAAVGELSGYLLGFSGQGLAERSETLVRVSDWMVLNRKFSGLAILVMAAIPNPFFDLAGIAAGTLKIPVWRFLLSCAVGSIIKMMAFAFAGNQSIHWISHP
jgi:membrane protein YqaA with SNARE-associated domain